MKMLEINNLVKYYGGSVGVDGVSFSVEKGSVFGFIGPNGAGKSTTIRCIMNLINKTSGEILFESRPLLKNDKAAYANIGYLPSEINLYSDMTVEKMIAYNDSFYSFDTLKKAGELAQKLHLDTKKKINSLSLGNAKKAGIVLALAHSPKMVIMDEATGGLDPLVQEEVYKIIAAEKESGTSFLFSSHNLPEVKRICDTVGIIRDGKIVRVAAINELLTADAVKIRLISDTEPDGDFKILGKNGDEYVLMCEKNIDYIVKKLAQQNIKKLTIEEPDLEEIFIHYYE